MQGKGGDAGPRPPVKSQASVEEMMVERIHVGLVGRVAFECLALDLIPGLPQTLKPIRHPRVPDALRSDELDDPGTQLGTSLKAVKLMGPVGEDDDEEEEETDHLVTTLAFRGATGKKGLGALMRTRSKAKDEAAEPPVLRLDVVKGKGMLGMSVAVDPNSVPPNGFTVGRLEGNGLVLHDPEVMIICVGCTPPRSADPVARLVDRPQISGRHLALSLDGSDRMVWTVVDLGSLNGTLLNDEPIHAEGRVRGSERPVKDGDLIKLGQMTVVKVSLVTGHRPPALVIADLEASRLAAVAEGAGSQTPLARVRLGQPSFLDSFNPGGSDPWGVEVGRPFGDIQQFRCVALGIECAIVSRTGREHLRENKPREDQAFAHIPLYPACGPGTKIDPKSLPVVAAVGILDGHAGDQCAAAARGILPQEVAKRVVASLKAGGTPKDFQDVLSNGFLSADHELLSSEGPAGDQVGPASLCLGSWERRGPWPHR